MINVELFVKLRKQKGLNQKQLARAVGVSQQLIGEIETGRTRSTKVIYRIARVLETTANVLDPEIPAPLPLEKHFAKVMELLKKLPDIEADFHVRKFEETLRFLINAKKPND